MNKIKVAILGIVHQKGLDFLRQKDFEVFEVKNFEPEYLKEKLEFVDGILLRTSKLDKNILKNCSKLKIISRHGVGYDNVDADYLNQKKIALGITSKSNAVSVAEHVMTFFMYLTKNLSTSDKLVRDGNFKKKSELPDFFELYEKKVLIFGFGRIGKEVAKRCHGFGMKVYVYDPFLDNNVIEEHNCIPTGKKEGLSLADYITIHLPLNEDTKNFISKTEFNVMKKNSIVFALSNPNPEIMPKDVPANVSIIATGRSDYPNQVNNSLAYPGFFRGLIDSRAKKITVEMEIAASKALASVIENENLSEDLIELIAMN